jgi:cysteine desulfurase/selenocysteine lyase
MPIIGDAYDVRAIRQQFPALQQESGGRPLAYLDNAATTQRPQAVLDAMTEIYTRANANVHRGVHAWSLKATEAFEAARERVRQHIGAREACEIVFTKGCTEAINLVAQSWGVLGGGLGEASDQVSAKRVRVIGESEKTFRSGSGVILVSTLEHHANIVPWQIAAAQTGCEIVPIPILDTGEIDLDGYRKLLTERVRLVAIKHVCNALGVIQPIGEMTRLAHAVGAKVMVDGAQALAHQMVNVTDLDVDFYAMSAHKVYGPFGVGALYAKRELLEQMPPYQAGGDMIREVDFAETTFAGLPNRFEPGTPNVAGVVGFGAALEFLRTVGVERAGAHERCLAEYAESLLGEIDGVEVKGRSKNKAGIVSFTVRGVHPHDLGTVLDDRGVAVRAGHHCCMPLMRRLGIPATTRASFAMYSTTEEVDRLVEGVLHAKERLT